MQVAFERVVVVRVLFQIDLLDPAEVVRTLQTAPAVHKLQPEICRFVLSIPIHLELAFDRAERI